MTITGHGTRHFGSKLSFPMCHVIVIVYIKFDFTLTFLTPDTVNVNTGYYAASRGNPLTKIRDNVSVPSSRVKSLRSLLGLSDP
jgi:hypothetical protein